MLLLIYFGVTYLVLMSEYPGQTGNPNRFFVGLALNTARSSVIPTLYNYTRANQSDVIFSEIYGLSDSQSVENLREREIMSVNVQSYFPDIYTNGLFDNREAVHDSAKAEIVVSLSLCLFTAQLCKNSLMYKFLRDALRWYRPPYLSFVYG